MAAKRSAPPLWKLVCEIIPVVQRERDIMVDSYGSPGGGVEMMADVIADLGSETSSRYSKHFTAAIHADALQEKNSADAGNDDGQPARIRG
jgi:hypothetical protein